MPANVSPMVRRRRLAAELRRLRERKGLTGDQVAEILGWSPSKVSRYELARTGLKPADVRRMLEAYGVDGQRQNDLLALARQATAKGWWEQYSDVIDEEYLSLIGLEDEATSEWSWHLEVIPGLLQTEAYARQVNMKGQLLAAVPPGQIERSVEMRMRRQETLTRDPPLRLTAILDESVLRRHLAGSDVMRDQLKRLVEFADLPSVSIRVLQLSDDYPLIINSFDLLQFEGEEATSMPDVVWTEHLTSTLHFEGEADTYQYRLVFQHLLDSALGPSESLNVIARTATEVWS